MTEVIRLFTAEVRGVTREVVISIPEHLADDIEEAELIVTESAAYYAKFFEYADSNDYYAELSNPRLLVVSAYSG